jgi:hypothetical protein
MCLLVRDKSQPFLCPSMQVTLLATIKSIRFHPLANSNCSASSLFILLRLRLESVCAESPPSYHWHIVYRLWPQTKTGQSRRIIHRDKEELLLRGSARAHRHRLNFPF